VPKWHRREINVEDDLTETYAHFASRGMDAIEHQEAITESSVGIVPFSCDIAWAFPPISSHNCNYGTFIGCCPYRPGAKLDLDVS